MTLWHPNDQAAIGREAARLSALERLDVLDTPSEASFDRIARLAKRLFGVPSPSSRSSMRTASGTKRPKV
jgi:hypothetical protein